MARSLPNQTNKLFTKQKDETKSIVGRPREKWTVLLILDCFQNEFFGIKRPRMVSAFARNN